MSPRAPAGFLNINKPLHLTSHDVVARVRRQYRARSGGKKVGHAGTLDPLADGVLVICLGAATRLSEYVMRGQKTYQARITFGATTSTYDRAGERLCQRDASLLTLQRIEAALPQFLGDISQVPPMHSAIKQGGKKLYELARQGKTVERPARLVRILSIEILSWQPPQLELKIRCGPGTYIRSLAHDLGQTLEVGAYLSGLTRLASGRFAIDDSLKLMALDEEGEWLERIISPYEALADFQRVILSEDLIAAIQNGGSIPAQESLTAPIFAFDSLERLLAILEPRGQQWKPRKVFPRGS